MDLRRRRVAVTAGVVALLAIAGIAGGVVAATSGDDEELTGPARERAIEAALAHTGGGTVTEAEIGDGGAAYEVELRLADGRQVEVELDGNFRVLGSAPDDDGPNDTDDDDHDGAVDDD